MFDMATGGDPEVQSEFYPGTVTGRVQEVLMNARSAGDRVALLMAHIAAIDRIDATHGFHAGDELLASVVKQLRSKLLRRFDSIEVVSRDEFICVLRPMPSEGLAMLAGQRVLSLLSAPVEFGESSAMADVAVGIAMFPEHGGDAEELLRKAKHALQSARVHREHLYLYESEGTSQALDRLQYERRLRSALDRNSLELHFQPQLNQRTGKLERAEALLRWNDEVLGRVPPNIAVEVAETAGLIDRLTLWVVTSAVQRCAEFGKICPGFAVSVNMSPSNLREADLPLYIDRALRTWGVRGRDLVAEITETAMMADQLKANEALNELKSYGVRLSIDDFGTGYSSMYYLARLPLDELKIDLMFVKSMLEVSHDAKIVRSLIELAHNLDLEVVAEGVESEPIQMALQHLGCDYLQGYHIGKPMPAEELIKRLRQ
jgi:diguanylate cyclase (GGDEF)-like protein